jgi:hypothetical protein
MRIALAAVVGYVVYFVWIAVTYSVLWIMTGASFAYLPGTTNVTAGWLVAATPVNLAGAALAGWMALWIAKGDRRGVLGVSTLLLLFGIACAVMSHTMDRSLPPGKTPATLTAQEAGEFSVQPIWYDAMMPLLTAAAAMFGGRKREEVDRSVSVAAA